MPIPKFPTWIQHDDGSCSYYGQHVVAGGLRLNCSAHLGGVQPFGDGRYNWIRRPVKLGYRNWKVRHAEKGLADSRQEAMKEVEKGWGESSGGTLTGFFSDDELEAVFVHGGWISYLNMGIEVRFPSAEDYDRWSSEQAAKNPQGWTTCMRIGR